MVNEHQHGESDPWFPMATQQEGREAMRDMKIPNEGGPEELGGSREEQPVRDMLGYTCFTSFLAGVIQHASVWLHCLEELQGLVQVMAALALVHRGATPPSEGAHAAAAAHPSTLHPSDGMKTKGRQEKRTKEKSKQLRWSRSRWRQGLDVSS